MTWVARTLRVECWMLEKGMNEEEEAQAAAPGRPWLLIIGAAVLGFVLGAGAGFGGATMLGGEEVAQADEDPNVGMDPHLVHALDPFTVNLRGQGGGRVLRMVVELEINKNDQDSVVGETAQLRDAVLSLASDYTFSDLEGIDGKMHFRDELLGRVNRVLSGPRVERIYLTQFVVQ